ncbi:MAG: DUF5678 domain-containing protein [Candidatus Poribacteria bacterium]
MKGRIMSSNNTQNLSKFQKKYLHKDFLENERDYWNMRGNLLKSYKGKWIAIHKGNVVAVSDDLFSITDEVGRLNCRAYIAKVGEEDSVVFKVRRRQFNYDTTYSPFALPRAEVTFSNYSKTDSKLYSDVIPDTGGDLSVLLEDDGLDINLLSSPYFTTLSRGVVGPNIVTLAYRGNAEINGATYPSFIQLIPGDERILGRDVLNQVKVTFDGPGDTVIFEI